MVFMGLKEAFDIVDHQILCRKLESYGVLHRELAWFGCNLLNRVQYSRFMPWSTLFLVYINHIPRAVKSSTINLGFYQS